MIMAIEKYYGTGRRKSSIARVYVMPGKGNVTINKRDIDDYFGLETLKVIVRQPLAAIDAADKFDVVVNVHGGGYTGQAGAIRHEGRIPYKRSSYEGKKEIRSQSSQKSTTVFKEIILSAELGYTERAISRVYSKMALFVYSRFHRNLKKSLFHLRNSDRRCFFI